MDFSLLSNVCFACRLLSFAPFTLLFLCVCREDLFRVFRIKMAS